jgi:YesN/AraC family two-component response regulator
MQKIRVLVVDDQTIVLDGICALLGLARDTQLVGETGSGRKALEVIRKLKLDIVPMDIATPIMGGLQATAECGRSLPDKSGGTYSI